MNIKQLSIFVENKEGKLGIVTGILAKAQIDMRALSLADTADFGIMRVIVSDADKARDYLLDNHILARVNHVIAVAIPDEPGSLSKMINTLSKSGVNIEYLYAFNKTYKDLVCFVVRVDYNDKACHVLSSNGFKVLCSEDLELV